MIDLSAIRSRVMELVPGLADVSLKMTKDGAGLYFVCTMDKKQRVVFAEVVASVPILWGMYAGVHRTESQIASEIAKGLA